jgi:hypothetical protein
MDLNGIYRGLSPTDESGVGVGELEIVILDDTISFRFATGLKVESGQERRAELREMTTDEVAERFNPGAMNCLCWRYKQGFLTQKKLNTIRDFKK